MGEAASPTNSRLEGWLVICCEAALGLQWIGSPGKEAVPAGQTAGCSWQQRTLNRMSGAPFFGFDSDLNSDHKIALFLCCVSV